MFVHICNSYHNGGPDIVSHMHMVLRNVVTCWQTLDPYILAVIVANEKNSVSAVIRRTMNKLIRREGIHREGITYGVPETVQTSVIILEEIKRAITQNRQKKKPRCTFALGKSIFLPSRVPFLLFFTHET